MTVFPTDADLLRVPRPEVVRAALALARHLNDLLDLAEDVHGIAPTPTAADADPAGRGVPHV